MSKRETVLILTPLKNAAPHLDTYFERLQQLTYPPELLSIGFLESDSTDDTLATVDLQLARLRSCYRRAELWKRDFGFSIPPGMKRWDYPIQVQRRSILARSRNYLLSRALRDEDWVLWLDVDVVEYPPGIIERLIATGCEIVQPNCVKEYGGKSFDLNAWRNRGREYLHDLKPEGELVRLDAVGGTMLLVRADLHREGLVFPPFLYGRENPRARRRHHFSSDGLWTWLRPAVAGEIETEGLALMAYDMGSECWGLPHLEIRHKNA